MTDTRERLQAALGSAYALERELGQGGMATVDLARDLPHDREVALRELEPLLDHPRLGPLVRRLTLWATRPAAKAVPKVAGTAS